jgi:hypothetical protein
MVTVLVLPGINCDQDFKHAMQELYERVVRQRDMLKRLLEEASKATSLSEGGREVRLLTGPDDGAPENGQEVRPQFTHQIWGCLTMGSCS